jgi:DNA-binding MarR family transcriptional regulator
VHTRATLAGDLFGTIGRFRRQMRRTAGRSFDSVDAKVTLTESQAELLRLVGRQPGISVSQAAGELGWAANTASTLVSKLSAADLLVREPDADDRRIGRLRLTASAQSAADIARAARREALAEALDELADDEIDQLTAGLDVLTKITRMLQERQA